jgi:tetratricopeptide (TPR) repeat protein
LAPLLLLGGGELILRLAGYGYPTTFLLKTRIQGKDYLIPNDQFGFRFFPHSIARTPVPFRMLAVKPSGAIRIFLFGESAVLGDPDPSYGLARYLEVLLEAKYPGKQFEVVCGAMTAINSHVILPIAREMARYDGDLWLVYMGNNEMIGPYGASTVFGRSAPPLWMVRGLLAIKSTRVGQLLEALLAKASSRSSPPATWGGMQMFKHHELRPEDPARVRGSENFRRNLRDILSVAQRRNIPVCISTVASNLKDCAPFGSQHSPALTGDRLEQWQRAYAAGKALAEQGQAEGAVAEFAKAAEIDQAFAELQFRLGLAYLSLGKAELARDALIRARDADTLAFRSDSRLEQIVRDVAREFSGKQVYLVDSVRAIASRSTDGIPGDAWFYEHVHFNFDGNYLLARIFADEIARHLPASLTARGNAEWAAQAQCEQRLAATPWDQYRLWQLNYSRVSEPPFTEQMNDVPRARMYMGRLRELQERMDAAAQVRARATYEQALQLRPEDPFLLSNYSQFLDAIRDFRAAQIQQEEVHKLLPGFPGPLQKLGLLLVRQGRITEATNYFGAALKLRPDYVPALNELGLALAHQQKFAAAELIFARAERISPGFVETFLNRGFMKQSAGNLRGAVEDYHRAANFQAGGPAAYFDNAVALASSHQRPEAVRAFQAAVFMNPNFWQARYLLGVELAAYEQVEAAAAQFKEVVRLRPDLAKAHFNLGVALGKQRKVEQALNEFRATLQLSPTNHAARKYIETLELLQERKVASP